MKKTKKEDGVAVLVALGVLAVIMGLTFFFTSYIAILKNSAKNANDLTVARMLITATAQRIKAGMSVYANSVTENFYDVISTCNISTDPSITTDIAQNNIGTLLATTQNGIEYYTEDDFNNTPTSARPQWQYIKDDANKIAGRVSFVIVVDTGQINPSICVDTGFNAETNSIKAISEEEGINPYAISIKTDGDTAYGRPGINTNEINLKPIINGLAETALVDEYLEKISSSEAYSGKMPTNPAYSWYDIDYFFSSLDISEDSKDSFYKQFSFITQPSPEAYWIASSPSDTTKDEDEMYHRFNLKRSDWDTLVINDIVNPPAQYSTSSQQHDGTGIPWIMNWNPDTDSPQIAANLIDYCDTDTEATTDNEDNPTYVGLEKCPYINEAKIIFSGTMDGSGNSTIQAEADIELINIYDDIINDITLTIRGEATYTVRYISLIFIFPNSPVTNNTFTYEVTTTITGQAPNRILTIEIPPTTIETTSGNENGTVLYRSLSNFKITDLKIKLEDNTGNKFYDFSYLVDNTYDSDPNNSAQLYYWIHEDVVTFIETVLNIIVDILNVFIEPDISSVDLSSYANDHHFFNYFHSSINDPRQNLNVSDWNNGQFSASNPSDTLNTNNSNCIPNPGGNADEETSAVYPWDISTTYIRNAPMESPWELGAIHRGAIWQTLNLKEYNDNNNVGLGGGESYSDGDANILNQIKMTTAIDTPGKINLNQQGQTVLESLFYNIVQKGDEYDSIPYELTDMQNPSTILINENESTDTAQQIINELSSTNLKTRAELLNDPEIITILTQNAGQSTDAEQEGIISKFINITDITDSPVETVKIIIVTQCIQDLSGVSGSLTGIYDPNIDKITATQKALLTIQKDHITNKFKIIKFEYLHN
jgi:hypothetical protein